MCRHVEEPVLDLCLFVFSQRDWNKSFVCFCLNLNWKFAVDSAAAHLARGLEDVLFRSLQLCSPGCALLLFSPFRSAGLGDPFSFTGLNVVIAGVFCAGNPSQETAASLLRECLSRVCSPEGLLQPGSTVKWEVQQAGGCFITSALCWWRNCRQPRAEIENSWLLLK